MVPESTAILKLVRSFVTAIKLNIPSSCQQFQHFWDDILHQQGSPKDVHTQPDYVTFSSTGGISVTRTTTSATKTNDKLTTMRMIWTMKAQESCTTSSLSKTFFTYTALNTEGHVAMRSDSKV
jgi:hypothetical protein